MSLILLFGAASVLLLPLSSSPQVTAAHSTAGYWHTSGSQILDGRNQPVRISGLNWSGFETTNGVVGGLDVQDYRTILHTMRANGYNTVRIPLSNEMVESPTIPGHIAFTGTQGRINTDLKDLDSMRILDHIIAAAGRAGLKVILDNHRSEAGSSAEENGLWYTARYPESAWVADWVALARRYQDDPTVIGMDLRNEPHNADSGGACWDCGGANDWHRAAERAGNAVLQVNPRLLIFVEGVDAYEGSASWWGGNLAGARRSPVHLNVPARLVYSAHVYGPTEYHQAWFNAQTSATTLAALYRRQWAYISESGIAPVWVGEFGTPNQNADIQSSDPGSEGQWFSTFISFLRAHPEIGWTYWGANGEDRYALLDPGYTDRPANANKAMALASITQGGLNRSLAKLASVSRDGFERGAAAGGQTFTGERAGSADPVQLADETTVISVPLHVASPVGAEIERPASQEQRVQARVQVAAAWRSGAPAVSSPGAQSRGGNLAHSTVRVNDAVAEQVRRANADALQHAGLIEEN